MAVYKYGSLMGLSSDEF